MNLPYLLQRLQDFLESSLKPKDGQLGLTQSFIFIRLTVSILSFGTLASLLWLFYAQTEEIVVAPGKLIPTGDVKTIQIPVGGVLSEISVAEGQRVKKGQVLLRLDNEATFSRSLNINQSIQAKTAQLSLKRLEKTRYLSYNQTEQDVLSDNLKLETEILYRLKQLKALGAVPELQYLQQLNKTKEIKGQITKLKVDRFRQVAILDQAIKQIQSERYDLESNYKDLTVNIKYQLIKSPVDGIVFDLKPKASGFVAQTSEPVLKLVPFSALQAKVEVNSSNIGFVRVGKDVDISIDSFPASDFGVLHGSVSRIGSDALAPDQYNQNYRFPTIIQLKSQSLHLNNGVVLPLQVGMSVTANIKLRKVSYFQLLVGSLQGKARSLQQI